MRKQKLDTAKVQAFKLGYRYSLISRSNKEILGNLIEEILEYSSTPEVLSAFRTGEYHGSQERKIIESTINRGFEERELAKQKDEEERIRKEIEELQKIREDNQKGKTQNKTR